MLISCVGFFFSFESFCYFYSYSQCSRLDPGNGFITEVIPKPSK